MPKQEPTKFEAKMSGAFDVDPVDSDEILPGDQVVVVLVAKVKSVGNETIESSGEGKWTCGLKIRSAGIVRDEELLERIGEELGVAMPEPQLPFPKIPPAVSNGSGATVVGSVLDESDDDDVLPEPAPFVPVAANPAKNVNSDEALRSFLELD